MKNSLLSLLLIIFLSCNSKENNETNPNLYNFYKEKQFIKLELSNTDKTDPLYYFYKGVFANVSNKPALSNVFLDSLKSQKDLMLIDSIAFNFWNLKADNYIKLYDYKNALTTTELIISKYSEFLTEDELKDNQNTYKIWKSLKSQLPQTISTFKETTIPTKLDLAKLINVTVNSEGKSVDFVFDTGAGMSSVMESVAKDLGFIFLEDYGAKVGGFSEVDNPVKIAIAKEFNINGIIIKNSAFLVFKDEALTFANGAYKINGIIGLPIAKDLGTITLTKDKLIVSKETKSIPLKERNLFIEMLHPIIYLKYNNLRLPCIFDTGADHSVLSDKFYKKFGKKLLSQGKIIENEISSAGGKMKYKALLLDSLEMNLGEQIVNLHNIEIYTEKHIVQGKEYYGNIGQDLLKQYKTITISFNQNYLKLLDKK